MVLVQKADISTTNKKLHICLRKWARPMTVHCVNTAKTEVKGGKMIAFVHTKLQYSVNQNA
jgi:hypothetical protein